MQVPAESEVSTLRANRNETRFVSASSRDGLIEPALAQPEYAHDALFRRAFHVLSSSEIAASGSHGVAMKMFYKLRLR